ncbi:MAG: tetratricopeptide repeat protein [Candidatus Polarisedimenticolia bacterium]|nr:tetratricopeptide repeat protein [bacterium]
MNAKEALVFKRAGLLAAALALAAFAAPAAVAQMVTVTGTVTMKDGGPLADVQVVAAGAKDGGGTRKVKTGKDGAYKLPFLKMGRYQITAHKEGLIMFTVAFEIKSGNGQVVSKNAGELGPKQEMPEVSFPPSASCTYDFVMVPENYYAGVLTGPEAEQMNTMINDANRLTQDGKFAESNAVVDQVLAKIPKALGPLYLKGINEAGLKNWDSAEKYLKLAIEADPKFVGPRGALADVCYRKGDKAQAVNWYDEEIKIAPDAIPVMLNRAALLDEMGRKDDALAAYQAILEKSPTEASAYTSIATIYTDKGQEDKAIEILQKMEQVAKPDAKAWFNIGANFSNADKLDRAEQAYRKALELDPNLAEANREMGYIALRKGDNATAVALLENYLGARPNADDAPAMKILIDKAKGATAQPAAPEPKPAKKPAGRK